MRDYWVISDTHFFHEGMLKFTDDAGNLIRGAKFSCVEEMNEHMIEKWNSVVKPGDYVYHLGDVTLGSKEEFKKMWPRLLGSKRLIVGNHDDIKFLAAGSFFKKIQMWRQLPELGLVLSHVPLNQSNLRCRAVNGLLNVHGHLHQNPSPKGPYFNVSVEVVDYTPVNLREIKNRRKNE